MPSNLNEFGTLPSNSIKSTKEISSIPSYLRKFKESFSKEIADWESNSQTSNVDAIILAIGSGANVIDDVTSKINYFSTFVLGKHGYDNRWQSLFTLDDNYLLAYFDGESYFKRLTINYDSGLVRYRNAESRNGNLPKNSTYFQQSFGYSDNLIEDVSKYRHNFRTSHSGNVAYNGFNAFDLYLWDATNDTPTEIGSRHVIRWNASGNEELISGFSIAGGVGIPVATIADRLAEKNNFAVPGKGVLYYNKSSNKYRYSENGDYFVNLGGSGSGSNGCLIQGCSLQLKDTDFSLISSNYCGNSVATRMYIIQKELLKSNIDIAFGAIDGELKESTLMIPEPCNELLGTSLFLTLRRDTSLDVDAVIEDMVRVDASTVKVAFGSDLSTYKVYTILATVTGYPEMTGIYTFSSYGASESTYVKDVAKTNAIVPGQLIFTRIVGLGTLPGVENGYSEVLTASPNPITFTSASNTDPSVRFNIITTNYFHRNDIVVDTVLETDSPLYGLGVVGGVDLSGVGTPTVLVIHPYDNKLSGVYFATSGAWDRYSQLDDAGDFSKTSIISVDNLNSTYLNNVYRIEPIQFFVEGVSNIPVVKTTSSDYSYYDNFITSNDYSGANTPNPQSNAVKPSLAYGNYKYAQIHLRCISTYLEKTWHDGNTATTSMSPDPEKKYAWQVFNETVSQF